METSVTQTAAGAGKGTGPEPGLRRPALRAGIAPVAGRMAAGLAGAAGLLAGQRLLLAPVMLGVGIGWYFSLAGEPGWTGWALVAAAALGGGALGLWLGRRGADGARSLGALVLLLALVPAGLGLGGLRAAQVAAPVLPFRYYGPVEGRIVVIDRSQSDALRLTLDRVRLDDLAPDRVPGRVRISLHGEGSGLVPVPGMRIAATAFLGPPEGPVEPGGFDFQRMAWFRGIGAVGYTRAPVMLLNAQGRALPVTRLRARISAAVQAAMPGREGAFAAAVTTGDRSAMDREVVQDLRDANLAHLLAISGLHMGLLTGFVYGALRLCLALVPGLALVRPVRKYAALGALAAGAFYLALSGGAVATERAFTMVAVMFGAVLLDRRAITLRSVALAALVILLRRPEAMVEPGFQMSFAATTALVAAFRALRGRAPPGRWRRLLAPVIGVALSSLVAGLATAPYAAAHFGRLSHVGLVANLAAVPVMGTLVMPLAVLAGLLAPLGLEAAALWLMRWPIAWILTVAQEVAGWPGAVGHVPAPGPFVLPLVTAGGLILCLGRGPARLAGALPLAIALALWSQVARPDVLISAGGGLVGVMTPEGRALSKPSGEGFASRSWLENDGDGAAQAEAAARAGFEGPREERRATLAGRRIAVISHRDAAARALTACAEAEIVVTSASVDATPAPGCLLIDAGHLARTGPLAIRIAGEELRVETARSRQGARPWTPVR